MGGAIQLYNLKLKIAKETAKGVEVYFIMDACRSNELPGGAEGQGFLNSAISEKRVGAVSNSLLALVASPKIEVFRWAAS